MILAVLDTTVLVSGFSGHQGAPAELINAWRSGTFQLIVSEPILIELANAWGEPYWRSRITRRDVEAAMALLRSRAIVTPIMIDVSGIATHPEDDLILATALSSGAEFLITGDRKLQELRHVELVTILSPRSFLDHLALL